MFKRKHQAAAVYRLTLSGPDGSAVLAVPLQEMPIPEACVLEMSMCFFHDPEPCEIHRGAVRFRAIAELQAACPVGQDVPVDRLTDFQQRCFADYHACSARIDAVTEP